jgi:hypothetical protein
MENQHEEEGGLGRVVVRSEKMADGQSVYWRTCFRRTSNVRSTSKRRVQCLDVGRLVALQVLAKVRKGERRGAARGKGYRMGSLYHEILEYRIGAFWRDSWDFPIAFTDA